MERNVHDLVVFTESMERVRSGFESLKYLGRLHSLDEVLAEAGVWVWARRNEDKPHRCPRCHGVVEGAREGSLGPRTVLRCPAGCRLKWRYGSRSWAWDKPSLSTWQPPWYGWGR